MTDSVTRGATGRTTTDDVSGTETVVVGLADGVATVTLNRPRRLNAATPEMFAGLHRVVDRLTADPEVRIVVFTGAGRGFCAGADLTFRDTGDADGSALRRNTTLVTALREMSQVTIAAVNGPCAGFGLALAAACDLRLAHESATFSSAYVKAGLSGDFGGMWTLSRLVGAARAGAMYLTADRVDAAEASAVGLLSAPPTDDLAAATAQLTERLQSWAPLALREIKANIRDAAILDLGDYLDLESRRHARLRSTEDAAEAAQAFIDKRDPVFVGR